MTFPRYSILFVILLIIALGLGTYFSTRDTGLDTPTPEPVAANPTIEGWNTQADPVRGITFQYPPQIDTKYITPVDWPPALQIIDEPFSCAAGGESEVMPGGKTEQISTGSRTYCVTREGEGAAGSVYTMYAYTFPYDGKTGILTFSLKATQCLNYDEPEQTACTAERADFNPDLLVNRIVGTIFETP